MTAPVCPDCGCDLDAIERRHAGLFRGLCRVCWDRQGERWLTAPETPPERDTRRDDEGPSAPAVPLVECVEACRGAEGGVTVFAWRREDLESHAPEGPHMHCPACGRVWRIQTYRPVLGADYPLRYLRPGLMEKAGK